MELTMLPDPLKKEERQRLYDLYYIHGDEKAKEEIVNRNLRLVVAVIRRQFCSYAGKFDEDDLFQVGAMGLVRGVENYDPTKDFKLSTFVVPYIYGHIRRFVDRYDMKMPKAFVTSLDGQPVGTAEDGEESYLEDFLASDEDVAQEVTDKQSEKEQIKIIREWMKNHVSQRNALMFEYRYGLIDGHPRSLEETSQEFGITRERVRQLCSKILRNLKFELLRHNFARRKLNGQIERDI